MTHKRHLQTLPDHHPGNVENARQDTVTNMASCVGRPDRLAPSDGGKFRVQVAAPTTREISHKSLTLMPPNPVTSALTVADWFAETLAAARVRRIYGIVGDSLIGLTDAARRRRKIERAHVRHTTRCSTATP